MKRITHVKCIIPFTKLAVREYGHFYSCCPAWTKMGKIGSCTAYHSLQDIWNGERIQYFRKAILEDELHKVCDFRYCPFAIKNTNLDLAAMKNNDPQFNRIIDQIMQGKTRLDTPPYLFEVAHSKQCNLDCVMCRPKVQLGDAELNEMIFTQIIPEMLPGLSRLLLAAHGEMLFNPHSRYFLKLLDAKRYPALRIQLLTNGTLFTPRLWASISHNHYESISVSIDAASKATYETIRRNGNWDVLRRNLDFISELRRQGVFKEFSISFIVMRSNYKEIKDFVNLGLALGCDLIFFQKITGLADMRENINFTSEREIFKEIADMLGDPLFGRPEVDTTLIDDYRHYSEVSGPASPHFIAGFRKTLLTSLIRIFKALGKNLPLKERLRKWLPGKELQWKLRLGING